MLKRTQTSAKASCLNRNWSGINRDFDPSWCLPNILRSQHVVDSLGYTLSALVGDYAWEMLINLLKSPITQWWGKWKSHPESVSGTKSWLISSSDWYRPNDNTNFQRNRLITFAVSLHTDSELITYICLGGGNNKCVNKTHIDKRGGPVQHPRSSWSWVGSIHGLGWVGSEFFNFWWVGWRLDCVIFLTL